MFALVLICSFAGEFSHNVDYYKLIELAYSIKLPHAKTPQISMNLQVA